MKYTLNVTDVDGNLNAYTQIQLATLSIADLFDQPLLGIQEIVELYDGNKESLAAELQVTKSTINNWIRRNYIPLNRLDALSRILNVSYCFLLFSVMIQLSVNSLNRRPTRAA